ncbi:MalY/PatB family protein [Clostridium sp. KNHs214]|uniref:MalY/PatB family protein n=1 Tax=Clostridium sp. KNHs214 TaxID=1540257 RepID=UPI000552CD7A|nr:MalY/PatB family protein [Clostridium sp. KNHs214]
MSYDFNKIVDRLHTKSVKWDLLEEMYGDKDVIPMWVADMDFEVPEEITKAIKERLNHEIFGYSFRGKEYNEAVINWMKRRHEWDIKSEWIKFTPGVVPALNFILRAFTKPGDHVIIQTPVYHPFARSIKNTGCTVVKNPLKYENFTYKMDLQDLEKKITNRTKILILCNPHNPVGRVWSKKELTALGEICLKHGVLVVSDEIHFDLIYKENKHTVFASISEEFAQNSITCTAPSKTFNIAGFQTSNIIIPNDKLRNLFSIELENLAINDPNIFGCEALIAAYNSGAQWLDDLIDYLKGNLDFLISFIEKRIPKIKVVKPEGTYLVWVDCSGLNMNGEEMREFFVKKVKLGLDDGIMFGEEGEKFQRVNIACPRIILKEALERIEKEANKL